jgi:hypothetical protein
MKIFYNPIKHLLVKEEINYKTQTIHLISEKFKIKLNITVIWIILKSGIVCKGDKERV